jgi:hypothetical protein
MKIVKEEKNVLNMVEMLMEDLSDPASLRAISRVPEPKGGMRYREVLQRLYLSLGIFHASVVIEFRDGKRKYYTFLARAIPDEAAKDFTECEVEAIGYIVEREKDGDIVYRIFEKSKLNNVKKLYSLISKVGDKYRWSDIEIYLKKIMEYDTYFWL